MGRLSVVLALVVVLAGCGSVVDGGTTPEEDTPTRTLTPAPVPTSATPTDELVTLPPGVTGDGIADPDALLDAHRSALRNRSYTLRARISVRGVVSERFTRVESPTRYYQRDVRYGTGSNVTRFASDTSVYTRSTYDSVTRYDRFEAVIPPRSTTVRESRALLELDSAAVTRTTRDGHTVFVVRGTYPTHPTLPGVRNFSLRVVVEPDGLVRSLHATYVRVEGATRTNVTRSFTYTDVGATTVERPAWVDREFNDTGE
ncbi:MAG: hypothetical protein V5A44_06750 [Haloarculaceae archaeon]